MQEIAQENRVVIVAVVAVLLAGWMFCASFVYSVTGTPLYYTWEQVGDKAKSVTDYCGINLTGMVFLDTDGDNSLNTTVHPGTPHAR